MFAYLNTSVTNVTGNGTGYTILFDTVSRGTGYNTGTGLFTCTVPGTYLIQTSFRMSNIINGANGNLCVISVNSYADPYRLSELACTAAKDIANRFTVNGMIAYNLVAGNTVSVVAQLNNGSAASVSIDGGTNPYLSWFYVKYLG
jgi:hypothetical protein